MTIEFDIPLPPVGRFKRKAYDADDGDRWRKVKHDLQEKCCGEVDSVGTCMAPACRQGEALRAMYEMLKHIDFSDGERKRLEAHVAEVGATVPPLVAEAMRLLCYKPGDGPFAHIDYCRWCHYAKDHPHGEDCVMRLLDGPSTS